MDMKGWLAMEQIVAAIIGVIAVLLANLINWQKVKDKLGKEKTLSLEEQHDSLSSEHNTLSSEHNTLSSEHSKIEHNLKGLITEKTSHIYGKVDRIDKVVDKNEERYMNLSVDQREIRNNINKFVYSWESVISENRELRIRMKDIKSEIGNLKSSLDNANNKIRNLESENATLGDRNKELVNALNIAIKKHKILKNENELDDEWGMER